MHLLGRSTQVGNISIVKYHTGKVVNINFSLLATGRYKEQIYILPYIKRLSQYQRNENKLTPHRLPTYKPSPTLWLSLWLREV